MITCLSICSIGGWHQTKVGAPSAFSPVATILRSSGGRGRSFSASSTGALELLLRRPDNRHCLRMVGGDDGIRLAGEETVEHVLAFDRIGLGAASAVPGSSRSPRRRRAVGPPTAQTRVLGLASAYSQNDVAGTRQRNSGFNHGRQGLVTGTLIDSQRLNRSVLAHAVVAVLQVSNASPPRTRSALRDVR
jgi:hypothetical protein